MTRFVLVVDLSTGTVRGAGGPADLFGASLMIPILDRSRRKICRPSTVRSRMGQSEMPPVTSHETRSSRKECP